MTGDVYLAMDTLLGKQVALKLLKGSLVNAEGFFKRFEREVAVCAALKSDHIVAITDYGVVNGKNPFYVMEYLHGQTLREKLEQNKQLSPKQAVNIISQACKGLKVAHEGVTLWKNNASESEQIKVVHRDLKPDNIFLQPSSFGEMVKIIDFGVVKLCADSEADESALTMQKSIIGTVRYAAPEQLDGLSTIDRRADIYSLGIILYEMLSGTDPFGLLSSSHRGSTGSSWIMAHATKPPNSFQEFPNCNHIPPDLEAVVMKCLQKSPSDRFDSVDELEQALQASVNPVSPDRALSIASASKEDDIFNGETIVSDPNNSSKNLGLLANQPASQPYANSDAPTLVISSLETVPSSTAEELESTVVVNRLGPPDWLVTFAPTSKRRLPIVLAGTLLVAGAAIAGGVYFYGQSKDLGILDAVNSLKSQKKYQECVAEAQKVDRDAKVYAEVQNALQQCRLDQAKQLAAENKLAEALALLGGIPTNSSVFPEAQKLMGQWSERTIALASEKYQIGDLKGAIAQVQTIPATSPTYAKSQSTTQQWQNDWQLADKQFNAAQTALKNNSLQEALDAANKMPKIAFWQNKVKPIVESAKTQLETIANPIAPSQQLDNTQGVTSSTSVAPSTTRSAPSTTPVVRQPIPSIPQPNIQWEDRGSSSNRSSQSSERHTNRSRSGKSK
ncbi:serine/threonine-protein kinase [Tumidithrix elongata RA019]|uniref:Serine/threonine-protein kinase n=1 Tax=Tumidithrix elongata BACA0141 TaxID=2716417 RepID=A0AAW9PXG5_9CYAN|nr:serine/threonine-protein kinase [Tumidithrix elongata RA019]